MSRMSGRSALPIPTLPVSVANGGMPTVGADGTVLIGSGGLPVFSTIVPVWKKYSVAYTDFQTAGLTKAVTILTLAAKGYIHRAILVITTPFAGTTTLSLSLGKTGSVARYIGVSDGTAVANTAYGDVLTGYLFESLTATTDIKVNAIATIDLLSSLSAGAADIYVMQSVLP